MFWSHHIIETSGAFPSVRYEYTPTLCNHCTDAACVAVCPQGAMTKDENGITVHDSEKCIGCQTCLKACPYGVINYNEEAADSEQKHEPLIEATELRKGAGGKERLCVPLHQQGQRGDLSCRAPKLDGGEVHILRSPGKERSAALLQSVCA